MQSIDGRRTGNRFLDTLPRDVADAVVRIANLRVYAEGTRLNAAGDAIREVCFPIAGAIVHLERLDGGRETEVFTIGAEGVSNFEAFFGASRALYARTAQVPVSAFVLDVRRLDLMHRHRAEIEALTDCYAIAMIRVAGLSAACARHDHVDARLAAWLLRLSDYAESDQFAVTHERTAEMLGARRASVTAAYNALKRDGAIRVSRKHVEIVEPERLRRVACSCRIHARATIDAVYRGGGTDGKRCAL